MKLSKHVMLAAGVLVAWLCGSTTVYGQTYQAQDWVLSMGGIISPVELGSDWGEVNVENITAGITHDAKLGEPGVGIDLQALYFVNPRLAVGAEFSQEWFLEELSSGWWVDGKTSQQRYLLAARVYLNPQSRAKVYAALGGGLAHTKISIDFSPEADFSYTGFGYYVGLGLDYALNHRWSLGAEMRYNGNKFHDKQTLANGDLAQVYRQANYLAGMLRVNYRM